MAKVYEFLADGLEEVEAITPVDLLRRAKVDVDVVSIMPSLEITASRDIKIKADKLLDEITFDEYDLLVLPGGVRGTNNLNACEELKKNLVKFPVLKGTIPHEVETSFGGAVVLLKPAAAGTGLKAGGAMRAVLESAGVKDVIAKSKGSSNAHNLVKATIKALTELRDAYTVAGERGISMDKVFNG